MLLRLLSFTNLILLTHALLEQQITFNSHRHLSTDNPVDHPKSLKFSPSDVSRLSHTHTALRVRPTIVYRPRSLETLHDARTRSLYSQESPAEALEWDVKEVLGPDVEDRHTLVQLARMSGNAYAFPGRSNWYEVDHAWNKSFPFGWEDPTEGFRGHVFLSEDNSTVVLSIKGTTISGPSSGKDKVNDNLLFSCCCARVDITWVFRTVCDCYSQHWRCDNTCLSNALIDESLFYSIGTRLVEDLIHIYPHANIWLTGHSLGGALASLLGATYGFPAVTFESPGERLAAARLHLPLPPSPPPLPLPLSILSVASSNNNAHPAHPHLPITHIYHTADPIPQGACTGLMSPCSQAGYALETRCHLGKSIVFDTVEKLGWHVDVRTHVIKAIITRLLEDDEVDWGGPREPGDGGGDGGEDDDEGWWDWFKHIFKPWNNDIVGVSGPRKKRRDVPEAIIEEDCVDCYKWEFGEFKKPNDGGGGGNDDDDDIPEPPDPN